jgi:hypothetical protein
MSDAMQMPDLVGDRPTMGTTGNTTRDKLAYDAIPRVGENPARPRAQSAANGDVFSEFSHAAYQSGIERPLTSLKQMAGMRVESAKPEPELHGAMAVAHAVGSAQDRSLTL